MTGSFAVANPYALEYLHCLVLTAYCPVSMRCSSAGWVARPALRVSKRRQWRCVGECDSVWRRVESTAVVLRFTWCLMC